MPTTAQSGSSETARAEAPIAPLTKPANNDLLSMRRLNVRHVTRVSRPAFKQRAHTLAVKCLPVRSSVQRCSTTDADSIPSRSMQTRHRNGPIIISPTIGGGGGSMASAAR
jgi:hypothetical protein